MASPPAIDEASRLDRSRNAAALGSRNVELGPMLRAGGRRISSEALQRFGRRSDDSADCTMSAGGDCAARRKSCSAATQRDVAAQHPLESMMRESRLLQCVPDFTQQNDILGRRSGSFRCSPEAVDLFHHHEDDQCEDQEIDEDRDEAAVGEYRHASLA